MIAWTPEARERERCRRAGEPVPDWARAKKRGPQVQREPDGTITPRRANNLRAYYRSQGKEVPDWVPPPLKPGRRSPDGGEQARKNRNRRHYEREKRIAVETKKAVSYIKHARGCADCGLKNPVVLQAHRAEDSKLGGAISMMIHRCTSQEKLTLLMTELHKATILCANCRLIRLDTAEEI